ncbi:hypothetical protein GGR50DRAFT_655681 [Xylaria sp. CBS 124048]|nr:hypothetical protein GGR50DRAFT_655681 [Xylaria sp. CBS 124048]
MSEREHHPVNGLEVVLNLVMHTGGPETPFTIARVSPTWQEFAEKWILKYLHTDSSNIRKVMEFLGGRPERFGLVRTLAYRINLPTYTAIDCTRQESNLNQLWNNQAFTQAIRLLFDELRKWPATGRTLTLELFPTSTSDMMKLVDDVWVRDQFGVAIPGDVIYFRHFGSTLECYQTFQGRIPCVTKICVSGDSERYLAVSAFRHFFQTFCNLREVDIKFWDHYKREPVEFRQEKRRRMAETLHLMPAGVTDFKFHVLYATQAAQELDPPNIMPEGEESDPLTVAFRQVSQRLTVVRVHGMLGTPELFWPFRIDAHNPEPFWPSLEYMEVYYHIVNPKGEWIFTSEDETEDWPPGAEPRFEAHESIHDWPDSIGYPEEDEWFYQDRIVADPRHMDGFYTSVAYAISKMPKLKQMRLHAIVYWETKLSPMHCFEYKRQGEQAIASWYALHRYKPSDSVLRDWEGMASAQGLDLEMRFKEPDFDEDYQRHEWD